MLNIPAIDPCYEIWCGYTKLKYFVAALNSKSFLVDVEKIIFLQADIDLLSNLCHL